MAAFTGTFLGAFFGVAAGTAGFWLLFCGFTMSVLGLTRWWAVLRIRRQVRRAVRSSSLHSSDWRGL